MKELFNLSWGENAIDYGYEEIKKTLYENESERRKVMSKPLSVAFYGMGKEGKELLNRYQMAFSNGDVKWKLAGVFDRNVRSVELAGIKKEVYGMDKLRLMQHDMIIITSSIYYSEIEEELVREGFDKSKIRNNSILNYVIKECTYASKEMSLK